MIMHLHKKVRYTVSLFYLETLFIRLSIGKIISILKNFTVIVSLSQKNVINLLKVVNMHRFL